jgi:hypothetical protein
MTLLYIYLYYIFAQQHWATFSRFLNFIDISHFTNISYFEHSGVVSFFEGAVSRQI